MRFSIPILLIGVSVGLAAPVPRRDEEPELLVVPATRENMNRLRNGSVKKIGGKEYKFDYDDKDHFDTHPFTSEVTYHEGWGPDGKIGEASPCSENHARPNSKPNSKPKAWGAPKAKPNFGGRHSNDKRRLPRPGDESFAEIVEEQPEEVDQNEKVSLGKASLEEAAELALIPPKKLKEPMIDTIDEMGGATDLQRELVDELKEITDKYKHVAEMYKTLYEAAKAADDELEEDSKEKLKVKSKHGKRGLKELDQNSLVLEAARNHGLLRDGPKNVVGHNKLIFEEPKDEQLVAKEQTRRLPEYNEKIHYGGPAKLQSVKDKLTIEPKILVLDKQLIEQLTAERASSSKAKKPAEAKASGPEKSGSKEEGAEETAPRKKGPLRFDNQKGKDLWNKFKEETLRPAGAKHGEQVSQGGKTGEQLWEDLKNWKGDSLKGADEIEQIGSKCKQEEIKEEQTEKQKANQRGKQPTAYSKNNGFYVEQEEAEKPGWLEFKKQFLESLQKQRPDLTQAHREKEFADYVRELEQVKDAADLKKAPGGQDQGEQQYRGIGRFRTPVPQPAAPQ